LAADVRRSAREFVEEVMSGVGPSAQTRERLVEGGMQRR
jgi:hypothetical protein